MIKSARLLVALAVCYCAPDAFAQTPRPLKVFISVDMEGIAGRASGTGTLTPAELYEYN